LIKVSELRTILGNLQKFCDSAGAKKASTDLQVFSDMLQPYGDVDVDNACASIKQRLVAEKPAKRPKASSRTGAAVLNESAIQLHLTELRTAGTDRNAFDVALKKLKASKSIKLPDLAEIARQLSRSETSYKSKAAALSDIEQAFVRQKRFENKVS
jgi:hypothetical protein